VQLVGGCRKLSPRRCGREGGGRPSASGRFGAVAATNTFANRPLPYPVSSDGGRPVASPDWFSTSIRRCAVSQEANIKLRVLAEQIATDLALRCCKPTEVGSVSPR